MEKIGCLGFVTMLPALIMVGCGAEENSSYETQLKLIAETSEIIEMGKFNEENYGGYAVTDLDRDGRLEIIFSCVMGSGWYSYNDYYEVNENIDGIEKCENRSEWTESEADILSQSEVDVFYDEAKDTYYYIFDDYLRDGLDLSYENRRAIYLTGNEINSVPLAFKTSVFDIEEDKWIVECTGADRENNISEEEYYKSAEIYFENLIRTEVEIGWQDSIPDGVFCETSDEIFAALQKSLNESSFGTNQ